MRFVLLIIVCVPGALLADITSSQHVWSAFRYQTNSSKSYTHVLQAQHRYTLTNEKLFEEQFNWISGYKTDIWALRILLTIGTTNGYEQLNEKRFGIEFERPYSLPGSIQYSIRLRQELRDFEGPEELAHRFRLRNQLSTPCSLVLFGSLFVNNEINIYLNDFERDRRGLSSSRTMIGGSNNYDRSEFSLAYLNDYRNEPEGLEVRHVLFISAEFR